MTGINQQGLGINIHSEAYTAMHPPHGPSLAVVAT
jgi:hypothetical protein